MSKLKNWDHLRSLIAAAREGSIAAAARSTSLEHSTLSRHLSALEAGIGSKLLERTPSGTMLTAAGVRLLEAAEHVQDIIARAEGDIGEQDYSVSGPVRIAAPEVVGALLLAPRLASLLRTHPGLMIQLVAMPNNYSLLKNETDIMLTFQPPKRGRLVCRKLADYHLCAYASKEYLAANPPIQKLDDLHSHQFINYTDYLQFSSYGDYLRIVVPEALARFQSSSMMAQLHATLQGAGICMLPHYLTRLHTGLVPVLPAETGLIRSWYLVYREESRKLARIRVVAEYLVKELAAIRSILTRLQD